ncbi:MAG: hypothetical protein AB1Z98_20175 [Nannocystaceae bacterium]
MAARSIFSLRVVRCPACHARLPIGGGEAMVVCEYCDARVEVVRRATPRPAPSAGTSSAASPPTRRHVATARFSSFMWTLLLAPLVIGVAIAASVYVATTPGAAAFLDPPTVSTTPSAPRGSSAIPHPPPPTPSPPAAPEPARGGDEPPAPATDRPPEPTRDEPPRAQPSRAPQGPVLSVAEAKAALEPKVLACMRTHRVHRLLTYLGNKTAGPVSLLRAPGSRVDGLRTTLVGTKLGRCIDQAGATVRTRAVKSNYVRLQLRNDQVADPLASLPAKADRDAIVATIETRDAQARACAAKHGQQGLREVFYFAIDGPTGEVISVRNGYGSKAFGRCATAAYRALKFGRVQQLEVKHTHHIQL